VQTFELEAHRPVVRKALQPPTCRGIYAALEYRTWWSWTKCARQGGRPQRRHQRVALPALLLVDADSIIEENALSARVKPFMEHPTRWWRRAASCASPTLQGARRPRGRDRLPNRMLPIFQVVEYLRAFLSGRIGWSTMRSLMISPAPSACTQSEVVAVAATTAGRRPRT